MVLTTSSCGARKKKGNGEMTEWRSRKRRREAGWGGGDGGGGGQEKHKAWVNTARSASGTN